MSGSRIGRVEVWLQAILTLELDGGEWPATYPGRYTPGERLPPANIAGAAWAPGAD
jgi:hypothetical protein